MAPPRYKSLFAGELSIFGLDVPAPVFYFLGVGLIASFALRRTGFGRHVYAVGGNATAARLSGVNVNRVKLIVFLISGLLAGLAALLHSALVNQGSHIDGNGYELNAIAAVVIGGTSLAGGVGTVFGSMIGALTLERPRQHPRPPQHRVGVPGDSQGRDHRPRRGAARRTSPARIHLNQGIRRTPLMRTTTRARLLTIALAPALALGVAGTVHGTTEPAGGGSGTCIPEGGIEAKDSYLIGMSQANQGEPWRQAMNDQIAAAAEAHPELEVVFADAAQDNAQQVADVENFLSQGIDLLIISPNEAAPLTDVVAAACAEGVPVIVLDRKVEGDQFTMWIGADNVQIGQQAGVLRRRSTAPSRVTIPAP